MAASGFSSRTMPLFPARVFRLVEDLARAIHPEAKWEQTAD